MLAKLLLLLRLNWAGGICCVRCTAKACEPTATGETLHSTKQYCSVLPGSPRGGSRPQQLLFSTLGSIALTCATSATGGLTKAMQPSKRAVLGVDHQRQGQNQSGNLGIKTGLPITAADKSCYTLGGW